jgi:hypothetical protein
MVGLLFFPELHRGYKWGTRMKRIGWTVAGLYLSPRNNPIFIPSTCGKTSFRLPVRDLTASITPRSYARVGLDQVHDKSHHHQLIKVFTNKVLVGKLL